MLPALLALLLCVTFAGKIDVLDYSIDFLNVGFTRELSFVFKLQSGLGTGGYLSLKLPFSLETTVTS